MARQKKDGQFINCYIKQEIADALNTYAEESGVPKTTIVEKALTAYLTSVNSDLENASLED